MDPQTSRRRLGTILSWYLIREFLGYFVPILLAFILLYLIVDFFDRLNILLKAQASVEASVRYFVFKIPLVVTQILPPAVLAALLLSLGMLSRRNELVAMRASGVSLLQTSAPLLLLAGAISVAALAWNETVVPYCTQQFQYVNFVEIRKRPQRAILSDRAMWYHGAHGFYNIDFVDPRRETLFGLTIYRTTPAFDLQSVIEIPSAKWLGSRWETPVAIERTVDAVGNVGTHEVPSNHVEIPETFGDFVEIRRDPEELSYLALRRWLAELSRKGIDASNYLVELNLKLAVPFATLVFACIAIPLAGRVQRHISIAAVIGTGLALGFSYWVLLALAYSLGQNGVLAPLVSAWAANVVFMLVGIALFLSSE